MFRFLGEVRAELAKVTWPTSTDVVRLTLTVLLITLVIGSYLGGVDFLFTNLLGLLVR